MKAETLQNAIAEAERFIRVARKVKIEEFSHIPDGKPHRRVMDNTKESAACKRASLDLTRSLAEMRKL